jgi:predicted enzyme related to lactoylglutathione lyase
MIKSIACTAYPITDMALSRTFYEKGLGLRISRNFRDEWVEYDLGEATFAIAILEMGHVPGAKRAVIAFEVTDLDGFVKTLKNNAVTFVAETFSTPVCRMAVIQDPDQNDITIHQRHGH